MKALLVVHGLDLVLELKLSCIEVLTLLAFLHYVLSLKLATSPALLVHVEHSLPSKLNQDNQIMNEERHENIKLYNI